MNPTLTARRAFLRTLAMAGSALATSSLLADEAASGLREPIHRVAKADSIGPAVASEHPLDPAFKIANEALARIQRDVTDYTAIIVKRERIKGELLPHEYMSAKIRNRKMEGNTLKTPLSVYLNFIKPDEMRGREVIWVEGQNNNKLRVHEGGGGVGKLLPSVWLPPDGALAMRGNLHPIWDIGIENLVVKLIEKGQAVRKLGPANCELTFTTGAKIKPSRNPKDDRVCTVLNVVHPQQLPGYEFHTAQIFMDDELQVPIRYIAYSWPSNPQDKIGPVLEEYTYLHLKLNVGLTKEDFDPDNPNYNF
jgi:hypothetical protein